MFDKSLYSVSLKFLVMSMSMTFNLRFLFLYSNE